MLCNPPVPVAPDEDPGHAMGAGGVAIGEIDMARGDRDIGRDLPGPEASAQAHFTKGRPVPPSAAGLAALKGP